MSFKQRKFRTKTSFDDEEDGAGAPQAEDAGAAAKAPPAAAAAATKEAVKKATAKAALLSFEDDAEPDEDVPKPAKKEKGRGSKFGAAPIVAQLPSSLAPTQAPSAGSRPESLLC